MSKSRLRINNLGNIISSCMVCKECSSQPNGGYFCEKLFETDRHHCTLRDYPTFPDNCPLSKVENPTINDKEFKKTKSMLMELLKCLDGAISLDDMAAILMQSKDEEGFKAELGEKINEINETRSCIKCINYVGCDHYGDIFSFCLTDINDNIDSHGAMECFMIAVANICRYWEE